MSALPYAGAICWRELSSPNPQAATQLYRDLFAWTSKDVDMGPMGTYTILNNGEEMVAGVMAGPGPEVPSHWINYVTVDDVDASAAQVVQLGGRVLMPPTDAPEIGRFSIVADPEGAVFGLLRDPSGQPAPAMDPCPKTGDFCWAQLMTRDIEAAQRFYSAIFGWKVQMYQGMVTLTRGDGGCGSMMTMPPPCARRGPGLLGELRRRRQPPRELRARLGLGRHLFGHADEHPQHRGLRLGLDARGRDDRPLEAPRGVIPSVVAATLGRDGRHGADDVLNPRHRCYPVGTAPQPR